MSVKLWKGYYMTWEQAESRKYAAQRPVDGWLSWIFVNLMKATIRGVMLAALLCGLAYFLVQANWAEQPVRWVLKHPDLVMWAALLMLGVYWVALLRWHPFEPSFDHPMDRLFWPMVFWWITAPATARDASRVVSTRRWVKVPVDIALHEDDAQTKLSWSVRYVDAEPFEDPPQRLAEHARSAHKAPPRLPPGSMLLRDRGFALDLFRVPWAEPSLALQVRNTQRPQAFAFGVSGEVIQAPDFEYQRLPMLARARVVLSPRACLELAQALHYQASVRGAKYPRYLDPKPAERLR